MIISRAQYVIYNDKEKHKVVIIVHWKKAVLNE
jgi:hypothetical protein